jgi:vitamin B12 transporter
METNAGMFGAAAIAFVLGGTAWGAGPAQPRDDGAYSLGEIVVSGKTEGAEATQSISIVTADDIRARDARTLDEALSLLPGVNIRRGAEGVPRIDVRGFRTRHVLLLLDGIPLNSATDEQFDPSIIPTENVAEIKLTRGTSSVLYGQGGLGGVINIITKKGREGLHGTASGEAGDHEPYLGRATVSGATGPVSVFVSGSSKRVNSYPLSADFSPTPEQGKGYRLNSDDRRNNAFGNVAFDVNPNLALGLTLHYAQGSYGKPSSVINDPLDPFATPPRYLRVDDFENVSAHAAIDYQPTTWAGVRAWAFINDLTEQDTQYDDASFRTFDLVAGSFRERIKSTVRGASAQPKLDLGRAGALTFLLSTERDEWDTSAMTTLGPGAVSPMNLNHVIDLYSAAVEYEAAPFDRLGVVAGYGEHWQARGSAHDQGFSALAGAHYDLFPATRLKASYSHNIRFPTLRDFYDPAQGNPDLLVERADTYELGLERRLPWDGIASATIFYTAAHNLIQTDPANGRSTNLADVRFRGVELAAAARFVRALLWRASFTYLDSQDLSRQGREEQQYTPREKATMEAKYDFAFGLTPYVSFLYVADQFYYTKNALTPVLKGRLTDIFELDVKVTQELLRNRLAVYAGATNLLDRNYETAYGFPQAGRFVYAGAELRF